MSDATRARDAAVAYVADRAGPLEQSVAAALAGREPPDAAVARLAAAQAPDGSLPDGGERIGSAVSGTLAALRILCDLGVPDAGPAESACAFLRSVQAGDGSWSLGDDSESARMEATGTLGGLLARTRFAHPLVIDAAGGYLEACWVPEKARDPAWRLIGAYLHYFANAIHELSDEILQRCGREIERGYRMGTLDAVDLARIFADCDAHALPGARVDRDELREALVACQRDDGGFGDASPLCSRGSIGRALDALLGLSRFA